LSALGINVVRDRIPNGLPKQVFDTLINIVVHKKPVLKAGVDLASHLTTKYTQGVGTAIAASMHAVPAAVQSALADLPHHDVQFHSIAQIAPELAHMHPSPTAPQHPLMPQPMNGGPDGHGSVHWSPVPTFKGASLAIQISPDGTARRALGSPSLAHLVFNVNV
jgi:hypothetical protein